jgi:hypothetical protein
MITTELRSGIGQQFHFHSFEGQDLHSLDFRNCVFLNCSFKDCNLENADCSRSNFSGSDFTGAVLRYTNFAHSKLYNIKFFPKDAYGVIFSLECDTFKGMKISKQWWYGYKYFSQIMIPELDKGSDPRDADIAAMGSEKYRALCSMFERRQL